MIREIRNTVYKTSDEKFFENRDEAERHEAKLSNVKAFAIFAMPDLSEDRHGPQLQGYLLVNAKSNHEMLVEYWCYKSYGNRVNFVMNKFASNSVREAWGFEPVDKNKLTGNVKMIGKIEESLVEPLWPKDEDVMRDTDFRG